MIHILKGISKWPLVSTWNYSTEGLSVLATINGVTISKNILFDDLWALLNAQGNPFGEWVVAGLDSSGAYFVSHIRDTSGFKPLSVRDPGSSGGTHILSAWAYSDRLEILCSGASENSFLNFPADSTLVTEPVRQANVDSFNGADMFKAFCPSLPTIQASKSDTALNISVSPCTQPIYLDVLDNGVSTQVKAEVTAGTTAASVSLPLPSGGVTISHSVKFLDPITLN